MKTPTLVIAMYAMACTSTFAGESVYSASLTRLAADIQALQSDIEEWRQGAIQRNRGGDVEQAAMTDLHAAELLQGVTAKTVNLLLAANSIEQLLPIIETTKRANAASILSIPLVHHLRELNQDIVLTQIEHKDVAVWKLFSRRTRDAAQRCMDQAKNILKESATSIPNTHANQPLEPTGVPPAAQR